MTIYFSTNIPALRATNVLSQATAQVGKSSTRLATGQRINSGADDPTGFALREGLRTSISGLEALSSGFANVQTKLNVAQTVYSNALLALHGDTINNTESTGLAGALEKYVAAAGDTDAEQAALSEVTAYRAALLGAVGTKANGKLIISDASTASTPSKVVVGMDSTNAAITINYTLKNQTELGIKPLLTAVDAFLAAPDATLAAAALTATETAVGNLSTASGSIGGTSNAISLIKSNYSAMNTSLRDAEGQISNVDTALEGSRLSQNELLAQNAMNVISYSRQFAAFVAGGAFA